MYLGQQQDHASSRAKNSTPTDQPHEKPVGRLHLLAGNVDRPVVIRLADCNCCRDATLEADWQIFVRVVRW